MAPCVRHANGATSPKTILPEFVLQHPGVWESQGVSARLSGPWMGLPSQVAHGLEEGAAAIEKESVQHGPNVMECRALGILGRAEA